MTTYFYTLAGVLILTSLAIWAYLASASYSTHMYRNKRSTRFANATYKWFLPLAMLASIAHLVYALACGYTTLGHFPGLMSALLLTQPCYESLTE